MGGGGGGWLWWVVVVKSFYVKPNCCVEVRLRLGWGFDNYDGRGSGNLHTAMLCL